MKKPAWAKRMDAVNYSIVGVLLLLVVWDTLMRLRGH
jgi:hypothetical protein